MDRRDDAAAAPAPWGMLEITCMPAPQRWSGASGAPREPHLDELLDDPIMALLWRGDRLEPRSARATVLGLREVVSRGRSRPRERLEA